MLAVVREGLKDKYPLGCAFVVQHIETAANAYDELNALLPSQVAVWTSEHDANPQQRHDSHVSQCPSLTTIRSSSSLMNSSRECAARGHVHIAAAA